eukprot:TRINITY_DN11035_c0_g2_i1.p1 TRINITY_DN11035_c0_g2~~TRINITY_DN11035_c0_g2_i1.p1  ORF type:complete len:104 (-),score=1.14 TRINITY_DN11035_c0_g2_i1:41-352(-)
MLSHIRLTPTHSQARGTISSVDPPRGLCPRARMRPPELTLKSPIPRKGRQHVLFPNHECESRICLLYTSDAADEEDSVDFGGSRTIKKQNIETQKDEELPDST